MWDDKERNRLIANYSSRVREYADAVTRLRFADKDTFLVTCAEVEKTRAASDQARLLFEHYLAKVQNFQDPENDIKC